VKRGPVHVKGGSDGWRAICQGCYVHGAEKATPEAAHVAWDTWVKQVRTRQGVVA
jgi:hypothetical protein